MANEKGPANAGKFKYESVSPRSEEEILSFWKENKIFEKSIGARKKAKDFVFFEGPPTANGMPGVHHVEARAFKDIILRYKTMRGFHVPRRAGWDTHGLPVEVEVEKKLGLKSKKDIENYGVAEFNKKCKESVWEYKELWEKLTDRMGFWIDMQNPYVTYDNLYIESLWAVINEFSKKKLLYEDYKVVPWCARCGTALSSHEVAQGYEKISEDSVYVKFKVEGEENTFLLAWTTTPWTLPGNVALAVNLKIDYVRAAGRGEKIILAKSRFDALGGEYQIEKTVAGKSLIGMKYEPLYPNEEAGEKGYKVIAANFVSTEDGSGIVHIAPAFGEDDFQASKTDDLPVLITTEADGLMRTPGFAWDKNWFKKTDVLVTADLDKRALLFKKEKYEHDYPFCWRCKNPLMYFARKAWWVDVNAVREKLIKNNQKINWHPEHIKDGRMGEWLKEKKNWAFSRERYWGTPLPVWRCGKCSKIKVIGSLKELDDLDMNPTELILMRHGQATHNMDGLLHAVGSGDDQKIILTEKGKIDVKVVALKLKKEKIDAIVLSPSHRVLETAEIIQKNNLIPAREIVPGLNDLFIGKEFEGKPEGIFKSLFAGIQERLANKPGGSENLRQVRTRAMKAIFEIRKKYGGKKVLVLSHGDPLWMLAAALEGVEEKNYYNVAGFEPADFRKMRLHNWPYNSDGELDMHKPYIDEIRLKCPSAGGCGGEMKRVPEVVDVWFDSGSMPFAQAHWPFDIKNPAYPADYIVEAVDQTRGWFYNLLAVGTLLGKGEPYKNVISLGHLLDKNAKKMSKSLGNIVDPIMLMDKYGADATRWYFFTINQPWDPKLFKEEDIRDTHRRFLMILWNSFVYWKTYGSGIKNYELRIKAKLVINKWLIAKWNKVLGKVTEDLENYDIVSAARGIEAFVLEDISHWYIRRIREHMKDEKSDNAKECGEVLGFVLRELAKTLAPFAPFIAEGIYKNTGGEEESVHLEDWPKVNLKIKNQNAKLIESMEKVREIVSKGLEARQKAGIKIRQPLQKLKIQKSKFKIDEELSDLVKGEVNVKEIEFSEKIKEDVELDTVISEELKGEGLVREFIRQVQDFRKELKLTPQDKVLLTVTGDGELEALLLKNKDILKKEISISDFKIRERGKFEEKEAMLDGRKLIIGISLF